MPKINREEYETLKGLSDKWKWIATDGERFIQELRKYDLTYMTLRLKKEFKENDEK